TPVCAHLLPPLLTGGADGRYGPCDPPGPSPAPGGKRGEGGRVGGPGRRTRDGVRGLRGRPPPVPPERSDRVGGAFPPVDGRLPPRAPRSDPRNRISGAAS